MNPSSRAGPAALSLGHFATASALLLLVPFQLSVPKNLRNCPLNVRFARRSHCWSQIVGTALALAPGTAAHEPSQEEKGKATEAWADEKGKFRVLVEGQPAGSEDFQISRSGNEWVARGSVEIPKASGGPAKLHGRLRLAADGSPLEYEYEWTPQGGKKVSAHVLFQGGTAHMESQVEGAAPFVQEFVFNTPRVAILDNNLYHHYILLARLYDWEKKGSQTFPVLIPQDQTPGSITVDWIGPGEIQGARLELLRMRSADLEIELFLDANHRLVRIRVPASKAEVVRE